MYKSKFLTVLILVFAAASVKASRLLMTLQNGGQSNETVEEAVPSRETQASRESYLKFLTSVSLLESQIEKIQDPKDQVIYLHKRLNEIESQRDKFEYSDVHDEISMDYILGSLREIPEPENFRIEDCDDYQTNLFIDFDPTSGSLKDPKEPSVKRAFQIFKKICR